MRHTAIKIVSAPPRMMTKAEAAEYCARPQKIRFSSEPGEFSAAIVIDLTALAAEMVKKSPKPLWKVVED